MIAYYNEIAPFAAEWLRKLIKAGHIAPGEVDERSIEDVIPSELMGYTQCHFFAGIGVWSYALRQAGWPDARPVWTGSCPCQPFSAAGKGGGTADERHLWPAFEWLIRKCRPDTIFGEQVESAIKHDWIDHVALSLEACGYAVGAVGFPAGSVGAPHIRQRLYWVADCTSTGLERSTSKGIQGGINRPTRRSPTRRVADASDTRREGEGKHGSGNEAQRTGAHAEFRRCSNAGVLGDSKERNRGLSIRQERREIIKLGRPGPTNGFWYNAEWLPCRDGKARPVEPGTFPLVDGTPNRVGRLRGYGNSIVAPQAEAFIRAFMELDSPERS